MGFLVVVACFTLFAGIVNTWVNPLRLTSTPWTAEKFDPYREISSQIRSGKAGMLRQAGELDAAFVGSSRVANGLDPNYPGWGGKKVLNLGCAGGFLFESVAIADHLIETGRTRTILLGIDPGDLTSSVDTRPLGDFYNSPFSTQGDAIDREIRYHVGISTLEQSFETIERLKLDRPASYTPDGLRVPRRGKGGPKQLQFIRSNIVGEAFLADDSPSGARINEQKIQALEELLEKALEHGTELILFLHPRHALLGADRDDIGTDACPYQLEREALVALVERVTSRHLDAAAIPLWDFLVFHPITTEPLPLDSSARMKHWSDLDHYSIEVGNAMQARILGLPVELKGASGFGRKIDSRSLGDHLDKLRSGYQRYLTEEGARDLDWKEETAAEEGP